MSGLDAETIAKLLEEEARQPTRQRSGRSKTDVTADRSLPVWYKLNQHICTKDCHHRVDPSNPTKPFTDSDTDLNQIGNACWNPDCKDPRNKETDRGANVVCEVKGQMICRFCYLDGYLLND